MSNLVFLELLERHGEEEVSELLLIRTCLDAYNDADTALCKGKFEYVALLSERFDITERLLEYMIENSENNSDLIESIKMHSEVINKKFKVFGKELDIQPIMGVSQLTGSYFYVPSTQNGLVGSSGAYVYFKKEDKKILEHCISLGMAYDTSEGATQHAEILMNAGVWS